MKNFYKTKTTGFTLAEVLITIGIIGIVAALTIPNLIQKNYEKRTVATLKETYSILTQAIRMAEEEYGDVASWEITDSDEASAKIIAERLKPFLKLSLDCGTENPDNVCNIKTYKRRNGQDVADYANMPKYYKMKLLNGSLIWIKAMDGGVKPIDIFVDVNGETKPNIWGTDLFEFLYYPDGNFRPSGTGHLGSCDYETGCLPQDSAGFCCAWHVINEGNMDYLHNK